jgi:hypothetical protein
MLNPHELAELMHNPAPGAVNTELDVTKRLWAVDRIDDRIMELRNLRKQHVDFYDEEIQKLEDQQEFLLHQVEVFLENTHRSNIKTPVGTVSRVSRSRIDWPSNEVLLAWSREKGLAVRVTEAPDKKAIEAFIKDTGELPPGAERIDYTTLSVRRPTAKAEPQPVQEEAHVFDL